jgi:predicted ATPase/DNA-binding XRE family transcriptional regulator
MSNPSMFRAWLRRRRQERGLTQEELGELVGYAGQTITKIEGGQRRPSPQLALRLAEALQLAPEEHPAWMAAAIADVAPEAPPQEAAAPEAAAPEARPLRQPMPSLGLPAYLTPFVGREREQAELADLLARRDCRLITVLGPGGVGKTRLAIEAGRSVQGFPDGVAFVSLASAAAPALIVPAIAEGLGFTFSGTGDLLTQLVAHLRDWRALLILDNLEHLLDPGGASLGLLERLLAQAPQVAMLATSRERLRLAGEWVLELEGLPVPAARSRKQLQAAPALKLFAQHAERVDRAFRLAPENEATVATICRLVDGLPLGIELAAAWLRLLSLDEIAQELGRGLDTAHLSPGTLPARHHSLRAVVEHSWQLLNAEERGALRRLAVFQGGFTREAAARVAGAGLPMLASLADKSLLRRGASGRYDLHEIIRQYADERLQEHQDELAATRGRHAAYCLQLVGEREQRIKGPEQAAATAEITAEIDNIRAAWPWAATHCQLDELERAGETLHWFYEFRSWLQEGTELFAQAVERLRAAGAANGGEGRRTLGRMLAHYGYLATRVGALAQADAALAESLALLRDGRDPLGLSRTLLNQGQLAYWTGDYSKARAALDESLDLTAATGDIHIRAMCQTIASHVALAVGSPAESEQHFRAALASWRAVGNPRGTVWCVTSCTETLLALGKHGEAEQLLRESLTMSYASGDSGGTAMTLHNLGRVALHHGDADAAIYFLREALPLLRSASHWVYAHALNDLGAALWQAGAKGEARATYGEALATALQVHVHQEGLRAAAGIATCLADAGQHAAALGLAARVLADPASGEATRRSAAEVQGAAQARLPDDEVAAIKGRASALPLAALLAELAGSI